MKVAEKAYHEIIDLFARRTNPESIVNFKPSARAQRRVRELLKQSKVDALSSEEDAELQRWAEIKLFMQLVKARLGCIWNHSNERDRSELGTGD